MKKLYILLGLFTFFQFSFSYQCVPRLEYAVEKDKVKYGSKEIKEADIKTFEIVDSSFSKDKKNVYYKGNKVLNVDAKTFIPVKTETYTGYCDFSGTRPRNLKVEIVTEFKDKNGEYKLEDIRTGKLKLEK